jgi:hypothetical protein
MVDRRLILAAGCSKLTARQDVDACGAYYPTASEVRFG